MIGAQIVEILRDLTYLIELLALKQQRKKGKKSCLYERGNFYLKDLIFDIDLILKKKNTFLNKYVSICLPNFTQLKKNKNVSMQISFLPYCPSRWVCYAE